LESNYDPTMLASGPYPEFLQARIRGPGGHLSNGESAALLSAAGRLRWACLAHLSEHNNHPDVALRTHRQVLGDRIPLHVATRWQPSDLLRL
jgi:phosphoribosyl 1,2-cyclic phosphodiesterase